MPQTRQCLGMHGDTFGEQNNSACAVAERDPKKCVCRSWGAYCFLIHIHVLRVSTLRCFKKACKHAQFACTYRVHKEIDAALKSVQTFNLFLKANNFLQLPVYCAKKPQSWSSAQAAARPSPKRSHNTVSVYSPAGSFARHYALLGSPLPLFLTMLLCRS